MNAERVLGVVAIAITAAACSQAGLRKQYVEMRGDMVGGRWDVAIGKLEKAKDDVYGEKDAVMYWLNMGTLLHYAGRVEESQANFVKAEEKMKEEWTTSVSAEASKVLLNETAQTYKGEDFERVLIYLYTSLNHAQKGNIQDALVEARAADEFLKWLKVQYEKEPDNTTVYTQDAFMLWLVGLYYEMEGANSLNDAYLAYKAAWEAYQKEYAKFGMAAPKFLAEDAVRTALLVGFKDDAAAIQQATGASGETVKAMTEKGEVIVFHGNGESPFKQELRFNGTMPDGYVMSIAVPEFVPTAPRVAYARISAAGAEAMTELAEPMTQIVLENFKHRLDGIKARAIARAIIKYAATKGAQKIGEAAGGGALGAVLGLAGNIASAATEAADLRSWTTLPADIGVARLWLPAGDHQLTVTYHNASGAQVGRTDSFNVSVQPGVRRLISVRSMD